MHTLTPRVVGIPWLVSVAFVLIVVMAQAVPTCAGPTDFHHVFPNKFREVFESRGIATDLYTVKMDRSLHRHQSWEWNKAWEKFLLENSGIPSKDELLAQAERMCRNGKLFPGIDRGAPFYDYKSGQLSNMGSVGKWQGSDSLRRLRLVNAARWMGRAYVAIDIGVMGLRTWKEWYDFRGVSGVTTELWILRGVRSVRAGLGVWVLYSWEVSSKPWVIALYAALIVAEDLVYRSLAQGVEQFELVLQRLEREDRYDIARDNVLRQMAMSQ